MLKKIDPRELDDNVFRLIGDEWMLITARFNGRVNPMTASWGGLGILLNMPVATVYVRPSRFTDPLVQKSQAFSLSFLLPGHKKILDACGALSGRDGDKVSRVGLTIEKLPDGGPAFREARLILSCRVLYAHRLLPECFTSPEPEAHYPRKDYHNIYIGAVTSAYLRH